MVNVLLRAEGRRKMNSAVRSEKMISMPDPLPKKEFSPRFMRISTATSGRAHIAVKDPEASVAEATAVLAVVEAKIVAGQRAVSVSLPEAAAAA